MLFTPFKKKQNISNIQREAEIIFPGSKPHAQLVVSDSVWQTILHIKAQHHSSRVNSVQVHFWNSSPPQASCIKFHIKTLPWSLYRKVTGWNTFLWVSLNASLWAQIMCVVVWSFIPTINPTPHYQTSTPTHFFCLPFFIISLLPYSLYNTLLCLSFNITLGTHTLKGSWIV